MRVLFVLQLGPDLLAEVLVQHGATLALLEEWHVLDVFGRFKVGADSGGCCFTL